MSESSNRVEMENESGEHTPQTRLLLVDDQEANLTALEAILTPLGCLLVKARSGVDALRELLEADFAVILLDVQMPTMDGFETARLIKQREKSRNIPLIFVTAMGADEKFLTEAYGIGAADYLVKPYSPVVLRSKVSVFVNLYQQREQIRQQTEALRQAERREMEFRVALREREQEQHYLAELTQRETEKAALAQEMVDMARRQRVFLRDVLSSLTEGRLHLCDTEDELPAPFPAFAKSVALTLPTLRNLRLQVMSLSEKVDWEIERLHDFETAIAEAAMNAAVHGKNGVGTVCLDASAGKAQVWIRDEGSGIAEERLHRATLERGYTTAGTLGHGFWIMLKTADRVHLLTSNRGTTIVLEQERVPPPPAWMQRLSIEGSADEMASGLTSSAGSL